MRRRTICADAWNQAGIEEVSFSCRSAASGSELNDADVKMAVFDCGKTLSMGFKGGQSADARSLGVGVETAQTITNKTSGVEPTMCRMSLGVRIGEAVRRDGKAAAEVCGSLMRSDGRVGDNTPALVRLGSGAANGDLRKDNTQNTQEHTETKGTEETMKAEVRRLTPKECERLMGFPDGYTECMGGDAARYAACGNSWASNCARRVLKGVHKADAKVEGAEKPFRYGTISSGVECHSLAARGLGDKAVFFSEISPAPVSLLKDHYPEVPVLGDMTLVDYDEERKCVHNRPYDGYSAPDAAALGFKPYATDGAVEIPCEKGEIDLVSGGTPCFTAGNMVLTESGYRPIEDIKVGDFVMTHRGRLRKVSAVGKKMAENIVEVKCATAPLIRCTADHKFWTPVNPHRDNRRHSVTYGKTLFDGMEFRPVSEIGSGGFAARLREYENAIKPGIPKPYRLTERDVCELAGWYVGDGHCAGFSAKKHKKVLILSLNAEKVETFRARFADRLNYCVTPHTQGVFRVQVSNATLCNWLVENFGRHSSGKRIPAWLIAADEETKGAFADGYMATDGFTDDRSDFACSTTSLPLALGLADLVGKCSVFLSKVPPTKTMFDGRVVRQHDFWMVRHSARKSLRFHDCEKWSNVRISRISRGEPETVYNITVEDDHGYVVNGICVSNCQSLSVAGKRHGMKEGSGTRSELAFQLPRIGQAVGARWLVWENVPGAFSSNGGRDLMWFAHRMAEAGYSLAWRVLDAQFVRTDTHPRAVPQRRRRIWMAAFKGGDWRVPCEALFEPMKTLGEESPKRTVGVGFTADLKAAAANGRQDGAESGDGKVGGALDDFNDFLKAADGKMVSLLVERGICVSPEKRIAELTEKESGGADGGKGAEAGTDLFGGLLFGGDDGKGAETRRQGAGLREADMDLRLPAQGSIRKLPLYELFSWARTVSREVCFCGEMFRPHEGEATVDDLDAQMLDNIGNAGILSDGICVTMKMPEWNAGVTEEELAGMPQDAAALYDGDVCGLSDVLEESPDAKYLLSWRGASGILRRAAKRGKVLPLELGYALLERIVDQAGRVKWVAENGKATTKNDGDLSERQVARTAFDDFVAPFRAWGEVESVAPSAKDDAETEAEDESEADDGAADERGEAGEDGDGE